MYLLKIYGAVSVHGSVDAFCSDDSGRDSGTFSVGSRRSISALGDEDMRTTKRQKPLNAPPPSPASPWNHSNSGDPALLMRHDSFERNFAFSETDTTFSVTDPRRDPRMRMRTSTDYSTDEVSEPSPSPSILDPPPSPASCFLRSNITPLARKESESSEDKIPKLARFSLTSPAEIDNSPPISSAGSTSSIHGQAPTPDWMNSPESVTSAGSRSKTKVEDCYEVKGRFENIAYLGSGSYGQVFSAIDKKTGARGWGAIR